MKAVLNEFILDRIKRRKEKVTGSVIVPPYLFVVNKQETWVVDVIIDATREIFYRVPIAENNRQIQNFINKDTPVEITKSSVGLAMVTGLANRKKQSVKVKKYALNMIKLGFTQGWRKIGVDDDDYETGPGNKPSIPDPSEKTYSYMSRKLGFDELDFGVTVFGAYIITKIEV